MIKLNTFKARQRDIIILVLPFCNNPVDITDPIVYPKYTILPKNPNNVFSMFISCFMMVEPAGRIPMSTLTKRFAKN